MSDALESWLYAMYPHIGPCVFCGSDDARHRIVDAIIERIETGEDEAEVLADYGLVRP